MLIAKDVDSLVDYSQGRPSKLARWNGDWTTMTEPIKFLAIPADRVLGPNVKGEFRAWIDESGDIRVASHSLLDSTSRLKVAIALLRLVEVDGLSPGGVSFV